MSTPDWVAQDFRSSLAYRLWRRAADLDGSVLENERAIEDENARLAIERPDEVEEEAGEEAGEKTDEEADEETADKDSPPDINGDGPPDIDEAATEPSDNDSSDGGYVSEEEDDVDWDDGSEYDDVERDENGDLDPPLSTSLPLPPTQTGCSPETTTRGPMSWRTTGESCAAILPLRTTSVYMVRYIASDSEHPDRRLTPCAYRSCKPSVHRSGR
jgi:hypothetical protein